MLKQKVINIKDHAHMIAIMSGHVRSGQVMSGQVRSGQVSSVHNIQNSTEVILYNTMILTTIR